MPHAPQLALSQDEDFFAAIRREDILLHHPFDSFQPVVEFLQRAARDSGLLAIKMTLYRLGRDSPVVDALLEAIRNGKQVVVVVELQARFDEKSNIEWARTLEREGVHVVHGLPGLKVHSKVALVVRREGDTIRRYLHLASGNYNPTTARLYTDMGLFTCDPEIGADATALFNYPTGYSGENRFRKLLVAPVNLRERLAELIRREIDHPRSGHDGSLIFKMNGLDDPGMIRLLSEASCAGVRVDLLVRGICCLRPGIPGLSENIRVTSIIVAGAIGVLDSFARFALQGLGTTAPVLPTRHLVVTGLYRYVRNPMYVAVVSAILGQALLLGNVALVAYGVLVWLLFHVFVLVYEEPTLRATFGSEYQSFCTAVPRWIPRVTPWQRS